MTPFLDYALKVNALLLLFIGFYILLLRRTTFLTLNRTYLVGTVGVAALLPLLPLPGLVLAWPWLTPEPIYATVSAGSLAVVGLASEPATPPVNWPLLGLWAYMLVAAALLCRTVWQTVALLGRIRQWPARRFADHVLVTPGLSDLPTFSFLTYLVLNPADVDSEAVRAHERVHIRQRHTLDLLFLDIVQALCWPNPALLAYKRAIRQVHEFLADRDAATATPRDDYARSLLHYAFHLPNPALTHTFGANSPNSPTLKQRIQMLYRNQSRPRSLWAYALVLPLAATLLALTNVPDPAAPPKTSPVVRGLVNSDPPAPVGQAPASFTQPTGADEVFNVVEQNPMFPGGAAALYRFLGRSIRYPAEAARQQVQGKVFVSFVVNTDGSVDRINILKGIGAGCDEEAVRVVSIMPKWQPGRQKGRAVAVKYNLPIQFSLGKKVGIGRVRNDSILEPLGRGTLDSMTIEYNGIERRNPLVVKSFRDAFNFSNASEPIYYINGVEVNIKAMQKLDPKQIESISVMKNNAGFQAGDKSGRGSVYIKTKAP